ncbi:helix-turn-helix transcriptional regulator [Serpentinicella sp. ANB-PHB4]|uniref:helix-turn-helix transcriptional regulator n=1 Tax=Serpentinicella sp. ANB-PHB4 TaxID=3074076 RepID=UPI002865DC02|nr:helix-turn-helix transcriptional regulator [Serpentinicella sp. ANB-PHB4]MDR5657994.1 helix-turn-helix transcriptional regulator [Serpentinicella sp. ANB-PHB4]
MIIIQLTSRQKKIVDIVKEHQPITSEHIAKYLTVTRAALRPDLSILTMTGVLDARPKVGYFYLGLPKNNQLLEEVSTIKVKDIMSLPIVVTEETTVYDTIVTLFLEDVGTIYVSSAGDLSGVVSRKDLLKSVIGGVDMNKMPVGMIMTRKPIITITQEENVMIAANKIIENEIDSLPVVELSDDDNKTKTKYNVIGRISKSNITKLFVELCKS